MTRGKSRHLARSDGRKNHSKPKIMPNVVPCKSFGDLVHVHEIARDILDELEKRLSEAGCPKINLMVRATNDGVLDFYRSLGYTDDEVVNLGKRLVKD